MIPSPEKLLLQISERVAPKRKAWVMAMRAELATISNGADKWKFAIGCLRTIVLDLAKTRRGLNYIARIAAAFFILVMSTVGIVMSKRLGASPDMFALSKILVALCFVYIGASILFIASLKALRVYAITGFCFAITCWAYCAAMRPKLETLPVEFLTAVSLEASGIMLGLIFTSIYLSWLYDPELSDAI